MDTKIASTLFAGGVNTVLPAVDAYMKNRNAQSLIDAALAAGDAIPLGLPSEEGEEVTSLTDKIASTASSGANTAINKMVKLFDPEAEETASLQDRIAAVEASLGPSFKFKLSQSCKNILDRFKNKLLGNSNGYYVTGAGGYRNNSDAVQCALDAMNMLASIPAIRDKIPTQIVDIAANAQVLGGILSTMAQYGYANDLAAALALTPSPQVKELAIGSAANDIVSTGNLEAINWMADELGAELISGFVPGLIGSIIRNYTELDGRIQRPEEFIGTLSRFNPNWGRYGEFYDLSVYEGASPMAIAAFNEYPPFRSLSMISYVNYLPYGRDNNPDQLEVVRDMYPSAIGIAPYIPNGSMIT